MLSYPLVKKRWSTRGDPFKILQIAKKT